MKQFEWGKIVFQPLNGKGKRVHFYPANPHDDDGGETLMERTVVDVRGKKGKKEEDG